MDKAEFDSIADTYHAQHAQHIAASGEAAEYFADAMEFGWRKFDSPAWGIFSVYAADARPRFGASP